MKDYSEMSDFDINCKAANFINKSSEFIDDVHCGKWDPCNNIADAWPIMLENKISIMWQASEKDWCAWSNGYLEEGCWDWKYCPDDYYIHASPLRAAMIVFLKMQEGKC